MKLYFIHRFPVKCIIWQKRGNDIIRIEDKGKRFTDDKGEFYFRFKKLKKNTVPIAWKYFYNILGKDETVLYVYSPSPYLFFPIELSAEFEDAVKSGNREELEKAMPDYIRKYITKEESPEKLRIPIDEKIEQWLDWEGFRIYKNSILTDYKGLLERYFPQLIFLVFLIVGAISFWILFRGSEGIMARAEASEQRWMANEERWIDYNNRLLNLVESGKVPLEVVKAPPAGV